MPRIITAASIVVSLAACTTQSTPTESAHTFVSIVGTPFLLAFKIPICAATVAIAAPTAALSSIADPSPNIAQSRLEPALDDGVARNCGPPYALIP